jgi:hypothetical protein
MPNPRLTADQKPMVEVREEDVGGVHLAPIRYLGLVKFGFEWKPNSI